jgi:hypothetical protein
MFLAIGTLWGEREKKKKRETSERQKGVGKKRDKKKTPLDRTKSYYYSHEARGKAPRQSRLFQLFNIYSTA